jgi:spore germination protein KC
MKKRNFLWILLMLLPLQGCWGTVEPHNFNYIVVIAFDYKDGEYYVYTQSLSFANVAKQDAGLPAEAPTNLIGVGKGETFDAAIQNLEETSPLPLHFGQIHSIVLSDSVVKEKLQVFQDLVLRSTFFRLNSWVFASKGDFIQTLQGESFFNMPSIFSIIYYPEDLLKQESFFPMIRFHEFLSSYSDDVSTIVIPSITVNESHWIEKKPKKIVVIDGGYVVEKKKKPVYLDKDSLRGLRWMNKEYHKIKVTAKKKEHLVGFKIRKVKFNVETIPNTEPTFAINLYLVTNISENEGLLKNKELESILKKEVEKEIKETYVEGIKNNHDVYSLAERAYRFKPKQWSFKQLRSLNEQSLQNVQVKVHIQNEGDLKK